MRVIDIPKRQRKRNQITNLRSDALFRVDERHPRLVELVVVAAVERRETDRLLAYERVECKLIMIDRLK